LAKQRVEELGIKNVVVSSSTGETGVKAVEFFKGYNLVVMTYVTGFSEPTIQKFTLQNRILIESNGGKILTTTTCIWCSRASRQYQVLCYSN